MNVSFADVSVEVTEGVGLVSFLLLKTAGALGPVSVQVATVDQSAEGTCMQMLAIVLCIVETTASACEIVNDRIIIFAVYYSGGITGS